MNKETELIPLSKYLILSRKQVNKIDLLKDLNGHKKGVYSFYWTGIDDEIPKNRRSATYKGKMGTDVTLPWKFSKKRPLCLYVGKTSDFPYRLSLHIKAGTISNEWYDGEVMLRENRVYKPTTSCQLRSGIEHLFVDSKDGLKQIHDHVAFRFEPIGNDVNRFYRECELIGKLRPWFNLDVER